MKKAAPPAPGSAPSRGSTTQKKASARADAQPTARFYYKGSRLRQLRAFCMIVKLGTLTRAAEALFLSQPSVSLQLRALEEEFGAQLIERRRRRVVPTRAGQALYDLALPLVDGMENLERQFHAVRAGLAGGELNIAAGTSTIQYLLPGFIAAFGASQPGVKLQLHNVTGKDGLALLRSDQVEFAVGSMLDVPNDLSYEPVRSYDPMLITPPDHALAKLRDVRLEDLSPYGLILPPKRLTTYRLVDLIFQQRKVPFHVAIELGGWEVIKHYVALGLGISIVTGICIGEADRERLAVRNMSAYFPQRSYGVVVRKGKHLSAEARGFIDLVRPGLFARHDYWEAGHSER